MLNELLDNGLPAEMTPGEPLYFLVSFTHRFADGLVIFRGPNAAGYTPDIKGAGAYTAAEAAKHEDAETVAVPVAWVHENCRIRMVIDQGDSHVMKGIFWNAANLRAASQSWAALVAKNAILQDSEVDKMAEMQGCDYQGHEFGASYPDSLCIDGYLWDADSGDADGDGWCYTVGGEIPCPKCNAVAYQEYCADQVQEVPNAELCGGPSGPSERAPGYASAPKTEE